jgi:hypothetical protein
LICRRDGHFQSGAPLITLHDSRAIIYSVSEYVQEDLAPAAVTVFEAVADAVDTDRHEVNRYPIAEVYMDGAR